MSEQQPPLEPGAGTAAGADPGVGAAPTGRPAEGADLVGHGGPGQPVQPAAVQPSTEPPAAPQQWSWTQAPVEPQWVETPPLEYHQLFRGVPRYRWWKPLLALVLGVFYYLTFSTVFGLAVIMPYLAFSGADITDPDVILELATPDTQNPMSLVLTLGSIALMIPTAILAMLSVGLGAGRRLWSVALKIRWRWIGRTVLPAFGALLVMNVLGIALELAFAGGAEAAAAEPPELNLQAALWSSLILLLLVPVQSTAEELVYRGLFMQTLGAWLGGVRGLGGAAVFLRGPWLPIVLPAILFGFSHIYDVWGWLAVVLMALAAGWISWRTGGLEAAIVLHAVNNLVAFGFMVFAFGGETGQTESGGGPGSVIGSAAGLALYAWWVDRDFSRRDGMRMRIDLVQARAGAAA